MRLNQFLRSLALLSFFIGGSLSTAQIVTNGSTWKYSKGLAEASTPVEAWRSPSFNDSAWLSGPAAFYYGEALTGTLLSDMQNGYSSIYLRYNFNLTTPSEVAALVLTGTSDDGFIAWINGVEIARYNMPAGFVAYNGAASAALESVEGTYTFTNQGGVLVTGNNVLAVHAFNSSLGASSDFAWFGSLASIITETQPPTLASFDPPAGPRTNLTEITVNFSEPVQGVDALDLQVGGNPAATVVGGPTSYTFIFPQPAYGNVQVAWSPSHNITDQALPPNPFNAAASTWQYQLTDNSAPIISSLTPSAGSTIASLGQIEVVFNEGVSGVQASDLTVGGQPATNVVVVSPAYYLFQFAPVPVGTVGVAWANGHGIKDLATVPNAFGGGSWIYRVDPDAVSTVIVISEFLAANNTTRADQDGEFSDWIEIFNGGNTSVDLFDWALTDSAGNLAKWKFPSTNLVPGEFLLIFASEKDRREAGGELHTNFKLSDGGEYLALVRPDGTIASEFSPSYPSQVRDVSYGFGFEVNNFTLVQSNAPVRVRIPTDAGLGDSWKLAGFADATWTAGVNGVGYDTGLSDPGENTYEGSVSSTSPVGYWRFKEAGGTTVTNQGSAGASLNGTLDGAVTLGQAGPRPPTFGGFDPGNTGARFSGSAQYIKTIGGILSGRSAFTIAGWVNPAATPGSRIGLFGQNDAVEFGFISPTELQCWTPGGGSVNAVHNMSPNTWYHLLAVGDGSSIRIFINGVVRGTGGAGTANYGTSADLFNIGGGGIFDILSANGNYFNGQIDEVVVYQRALSADEITLLYNAGQTAPNTSLNDLIATDVQTAMRGVNSSAYVRIPFQVADPGLVDRLSLHVRYDDGFVAFLNGQRVASANAPLTPAWNATATAQHSDQAARQFEEFTLANASSLLTGGENILALQGLNFSATNNDFLIQAFLTGVSVGSLSTNARYFTSPTPGGPNGTGADDLGPVIADVDHFPKVPADNQDLAVTARVSATFSPVSTISLRWQVMYGAMNTNAMFDDGLHGDGASGDRVFGAIIPASASTNGQMIRWSVIATDTAGHRSRWPLFDNPLDSQEFLGTVVTDPRVNTDLPLLQQFIQTPAAAENTTGTRCSIFYLGEFYDNVSVSLHGQSSGGFPKKSFNVDFPNDHRFLYREAQSRVADIKLITNYGDKSRMRNSLGYEFIAKAGSIAHFSFQVRIQQNSLFYSIADLIEDPDESWMERVGRDPNGALYKIYNSLESASGAEKKTREFEAGSADLAALVNSLNPALALSNRVTYAYDNIDLPQTVSYLVASALISHQDHGHKNFYVYRDSDGSGEWGLIPWDIDLDWGRNWIDASGYFTDTIYIDNVLDFYNTSQQGKGRNRFYDLIYNHPEFRAMYLRRLRTIMDTVLQPPGTPSAEGLIETRIREMMDLMDPPGIATSDADLDFARWPTWGNGNQMRAEAQRIIDLYLPGRRQFLFNSPNAVLVGERIPGRQPDNIIVRIASVEANPASGNQLEEYVCLTNNNAFAIDISGWSLKGAVDFTFRPGTVMPSNTVLYVSPDVRAFRARTSSPRGGQQRFVQGPYEGQLSARGEGLDLVDPYGRVINTFTYPGLPSLAQQSLRITEIMYNPSALPGNTNDPQNFEYIELKNVSASQTLSLSGVRFANGIDFNFSTGAVTSLTPGQRVVVVRNQAAFTARYGGGALIAGQYTGSLDSAGERVVLLDSANEEILDFHYNNSWYPITDGFGFSLVVIDDTASTERWDVADHWRPSGQVHGSPALPDSAVPIPPIRINEALSRSEVPPPTDTIELFNPTAQAVDVGHWYLSDDFTVPKKFRLPASTTIAANGYLIFNESSFNTGPNGFALSADNDEVYLFSGHANGDLTGYYHGFSFGAAENGVTFGRHVISTGQEHFVAQSTPSLGGQNSGPKVGPVVISEIMYHPAGPDEAQREFIELVNLTAQPVGLFDPAVPTNTWQLTDAVDFTFPANFILAGGGRVLIVGFDPIADPAALTAFRAAYGVDPGDTVLGPFSGQLDNASDSVELKKPTTLPTNELALVFVDKVEYRDEPPWPGGADGFGLSLQRLTESGYGNDPANWTATPPSAGRAPATGGTAPSVTTQPANQLVLAGMTAQLGVAATGSSQLRYQWRFAGEDIAGATEPTLQIPRVSLRDRGSYDVVVYNNFGSALSLEAFLDVQLAASFITQPQSFAVAPGTNITLSVQAYSPTPLTYQWRKNGIPLNGANGPSLALLNVDLSHAGTYDVVVTDSVGPVVSDPAVVRLLIRPVIVLHPVPQTNVIGSTVTLSVEVTNTATLPITYRWRKGGTTVATHIANTIVDFLTITNLQLTDVASYSVVVTNEAFGNPGFLSQVARVAVIALTDTDGDGMSDDYEINHGLNKDSAADANTDLDGDGISNRDEFLSGTDPQNPNSYLRIESVDAGGSLRLRFLAVESKTYSVLHRDNATSGEWHVLTGVPAISSTSGNSRMVEIIDTTGLVGERFYRLVTPGIPQ